MHAFAVKKLKVIKIFFNCKLLGDSFTHHVVLLYHHLVSIFKKHIVINIGSTSGTKLPLFLLATQ